MFLGKRFEKQTKIIENQRVKQITGIEQLGKSDPESDPLINNMIILIKKIAPHFQNKKKKIIRLQIIDVIKY